MKVFVAGGGIGGLSLALSLHAAGLDSVEVFEASAEIEEVGVGINVLPHAVRELTELGLAEGLAAAGLATGEFAMFNKHGQRIWAEPRGVAAGYRWPQYSIHRGRLLGVLLHQAVSWRGSAPARLHTRLPSRRLLADAHVGLRSGWLADGTGDVAVDVLVGGRRGPLRRYGRSCFRTRVIGAVEWASRMWRAVSRRHSRSSAGSDDGRSVGYFGKRAVIYPITTPSR